MAVTVSVYNQLTNLILAGALGQSSAIDKSNLRWKLLNNTATFVPTHTSQEQVDNGSKATVTMTIAAPGVITDTAHGFVAGQPVAFLTTGAIPTGLLPSVFYYVLAAGLSANTYQVSATAGGAAITTSGTQSGANTRYASGSYETYGNGWLPGGPTMTGVTVSSANIDAGANINDALITATNPDVVATGGSLPPSPAYNAELYDATSMKCLMFVSFGQAQQAGITTDFKFLINAAGLLNITTT